MRKKTFKIDLASSALTVLVTRRIGSVIKIYEEQRRLLKKEIRQINKSRKNPKTTDEKRWDLWYLKRFYASDFRQHAVLTAFLMFYSYLEEALIIISPIPSSEAIYPRKTGIEKQKDIFSKELNINISNFVGWQDLKDFSKIRHSILHVNGSVDFVNKNLDIEGVLRRHKGHVYIKNGTIKLRESILYKFNNDITEFIKWIITQTKTKKIA